MPANTPLAGTKKVVCGAMMTARRTEIVLGATEPLTFHLPSVKPEMEKLQVLVPKAYLFGPPLPPLMEGSALTEMLSQSLIQPSDRPGRGPPPGLPPRGRVAGLQWARCWHRCQSHWGSNRPPSACPGCLPLGWGLPHKRRTSPCSFPKQPGWCSWPHLVC